MVMVMMMMKTLTTAMTITVTIINYGVVKETMMILMIVTSNVEGDWVANSISLKIMCHTRVDARLLSADLVVYNTYMKT